MDLSSEQLAEFAGLLAGVGEFENTDFLRSRKSSPCRFLDHLGIGNRALALERCGSRERLDSRLAVMGDAFGNQSIHGMSLLRPDDLQYFAYGIFSLHIVAHRVCQSGIVRIDRKGRIFGCYDWRSRVRGGRLVVSGSHFV